MVTLPSAYPADLPGAFAVLKTRSRLAVDDLKVLAMIESAGELFYLAIAKSVPHREARDLLTRNGHEERGHAHRIVKAIRLLGGDGYALPADSDNPFVASVPAELPVNADLLGMLEHGEMDGDLQYQAWAEAEPNADVARLYRQNGSEESAHGVRVAQARRLLGGS